MVNHYIGKHWQEGSGPEQVSYDPATGEVAWSGRAATAEEVGPAVDAARAAFEGWAELPLEQRVQHLEAFADELRRHRDPLAQAISREVGKPRWEALTEVDAMINKVPVSIAAYRDRLAEQRLDLGDTTGATRYKPHGVLAVFGPFNLPGHLPNGHIVPALLAGNTVVFKPSELAPLVGQVMVERWQAAGLPAGVVNLVQGGRATGEALADHPGIDGLLFTGSFPTGRALARRFAEHPGKMLALEMGGNNPLIIHRVADLDAAAYLTVVSAFITAGQRCTCARRLILPRGEEGDQLLQKLAGLTQSLRVGPPDAEPEPFIGPVITPTAADRLLGAQDDLLKRGGRAIVALKRIGEIPAMLRPGLIDVTDLADRADEELFGPLLQVIRVSDFDTAITEANRTAYGLAAGLFSDDAALFERFVRRVRAGVVSWNRQTTGASGRLPFGGVGASGNHRPGGYFAADYTAYPVASLERDRLGMPAQRLPGIQP